MIFNINPLIENEELVKLISEMKDFLLGNRWNAKYSTEVLSDEENSEKIP